MALAGQVARHWPLNQDEPDLTLIRGWREEIECELVRLMLTSFPFPKGDYNRMLSMLELRREQVSIATAKAGFSSTADSGCAESKACVAPHAVCAS
jgi:hypothetical protein